MAKKAYIGVDGIARKVKRIYVGAQNPFAGEYQFADYLQNTGTEYIDTGFVANQSTRIVVDCDIDTTAGLAMRVYGFVDGGADLDCMLTDAGKWQIQYASASKTVTASEGGRLTIDQNKNAYTVTGATKTISGTFTATTFTCSGSLFVFGRMSNGTLYTSSPFKLYSCRIYDADVLVRDFVPCVNSQGEAGLYDRVNHKFYGNVADSGVFIVGDFTGEVINVPVNVARKVRRGYVGVGGVARPFWTGGELTYYGEIPLSAEFKDLTGANNKNYALFAGGHRNGSMSATVITYDKNLIAGMAPDSTNKSYDYGATSVGDHALFAGGGGHNSSYTTVDAYDSNLVKTAAPSLDRKSDRLSGTCNGNHAIFAGGLYVTESIDDDPNAYVYAYDENLTRTLLTDLDAARCDIAATSIGELAIFAGGVTGGSSGGRNYADVVDCYDATLTKLAVEKLTTQHEDRYAASVGGYALIAGGYGYSNGSNKYYDTVEVYDSNLTHTLGTPLSVGRAWAKGFSLCNYAAFAGGRNGEGSFATVDAYDENLTRTTPTGLAAADACLASAVIGDFALLASGNVSRNTVEAYTV